MKFEDAMDIVNRIASTSNCDKICTACPLYLLCDAFPKMPKRKIAFAWLDRDKKRSN